jgi:small subunit ribosomal protein S4
MGSPKFSKKKYNTPKHPWKEDRIESERELIKKYGLKNHKEVWKSKTFLSRYRQQARDLLAKPSGKNPQVKKESDQLLLHLNRMGILPAGSSLDDVLALETESILSRRLQTLVYLKGFSNTAFHSRQLINHGHIAIGERKVTIPGYLVAKEEENEIGYTAQSPLNELSHPARPKTDIYEPGVQPEKIKKTEEVTPTTKKDEKAEEKKEEEKPETEKESEKKPPIEEDKKPDEKQPDEDKKLDEKHTEKEPVAPEKINNEEKTPPNEKEEKIKKQDKSEKDEGGK